MKSLVAVAMLGIAAMCPRPAAAEQICVDVLVWTFAANQPANNCHPYDGPISCDTRHAELGTIVGVVVTVCVPKIIDLPPIDG